MTWSFRHARTKIVCINPCGHFVFNAVPNDSSGNMIVSYLRKFFFCPTESSVNRRDSRRSARRAGPVGGNGGSIRQSHASCLKVLQPSGSPTIKERHSAKNHPKPVPLQSAPRFDTVGQMEDDERCGGKVDQQDCAYGPGYIVCTFEQAGARL
jgi:hypothetical protein